MGRGTTHQLGIGGLFDVEVLERRAYYSQHVEACGFFPYSDCGLYHRY